MNRYLFAYYIDIEAEDEDRAWKDLQSILAEDGGKQMDILSGSMNEWWLEEIEYEDEE